MLESLVVVPEEEESPDVDEESVEVVVSEEVVSDEVEPVSVVVSYNTTNFVGSPCKNSDFTSARVNLSPTSIALR